MRRIPAMPRWGRVSFAPEVDARRRAVPQSSSLYRRCEAIEESIRLPAFCAGRTAWQACGDQQLRHFPDTTLVEVVGLRLSATRRP